MTMIQMLRVFFLVFWTTFRYSAGFLAVLMKGFTSVGYKSNWWASSPLLFLSFTFFIIAPSFPVTKWFPFHPLFPHFLLSHFLFRLVPLVYVCHKCTTKEPEKRRRRKMCAKVALSVCLWWIILSMFFTDTVLAGQSPSSHELIKPGWNGKQKIKNGSPGLWICCRQLRRM